MSSILTVRLDEDIKQRGTEVLRRHNITPSMAVQRLFDYMVKHDKMPFEENSQRDESEIRKMVAVLDTFHIKIPSALDAKELRAARLKERHG